MTSLRARTQSPADEELKLGAKGGAMYVLRTTLASTVLSAGLCGPAR